MSASDDSAGRSVELQICRQLLGKLINLTLASSAQEALQRSIQRSNPKGLTVQARPAPVDASRLVTVSLTLTADEVRILAADGHAAPVEQLLLSKVTEVVAAFEQQAGPIDDGFFDLRATGLLG